MNTRNIQVSFIYPPIPTRAFDWVAWVDGREEGAAGYGPTEKAAVEALLEQIEESE